MASSFLLRTASKRSLWHASLISRSVICGRVVRPSLLVQLQHHSFSTSQHSQSAASSTNNSHLSHTQQQDDDNNNKRRVSLYEMDSARIGAIESIEDLTDLVQQLEAMSTLTNEDVIPFIVPLVRMCCKEEYKQAGAELCERILFNILSRLPPDLSQRDEDLPFPTATLYQSALIAWGNLRTSEGAQRAERLFQLMMSEYLQEVEWAKNNNQKDNKRIIYSPAPDKGCYHSLLRAWAISGDPKAASASFEVLSEMERLSGIARILGEDPQISHATQQADAHKPTLEPPDRSCYNAVLGAYSRTLVLKHPHALQKAKNIVARMDSLYETTRDEEYCLDWFSYRSVLRTYWRYAAFLDRLEPRYVQEIEALLQRIREQDEKPKWWQRQPIMQRITIPDAYNVLVEALVKTEPLIQSIQRADGIVKAMAGKKKLPEIPFHHIRTWPKQKTIMKVVKGWERTGVPNVDERIEQLLQVAVETPFMRPFHLNTAMEEWTRSGWKFAPDLVETMLLRALDERTSRFRPTGQSFAIAIKVWLRSKNDEAPYRAELIFQKLLQLYESSPDVDYWRPREAHLRFVLTAWLEKCTTGRRYDGLGGNLYPAEHIEGLIQWFGDAPWMWNHTGHYSMAIRAWAKQELGTGEDEPNPVLRAVALLNELDKKVDVLSAFPCNWVLEACTRKQPTPERRQEAYNTAMEIFARGGRNARTYTLTLQVIKAHVEAMDDDHAQFIEELFQDCCARGMLRQDMIWQVVDLVCEDALQRLFGISHQYAAAIVQNRVDGLKRQGKEVSWKGRPPSTLLVQNLPQEWSRAADVGKDSRKPLVKS